MNKELYRQAYRDGFLDGVRYSSPVTGKFKRGRPRKKKRKTDGA